MKRTPDTEGWGSNPAMHGELYYLHRLKFWAKDYFGAKSADKVQERIDEYRTGLDSTPKRGDW